MNYIKQIMSLRMLVVYILGFISGLPLAFTGTTLQAWLATQHISIQTIGIFTLIGLPYSYKFVWAPLLDRYRPPLFFCMHKRKAWIFYCQLFLAGLLLLLACLQPRQQLLVVASVGLFIAMVSSSQDIVIDAYRTEYLTESERGLGSASFTFAYRLAMLISGGVGLIIADQWGWPSFFIFSAILMILGALVSLVLPNTLEHTNYSSGFASLFLQPICHFLQREYAWCILLFIASYKFAEGYILALATTFFLTAIHLSLSQVGILFKTVGFASTILGAYTGGLLLPKLGIYRGLLLFGLFQTITILFYVILAIIGQGYWLTAVTISLEMLASGMSTVALMAYFMSLCDRQFTGTQFALFSAIMVIGRIVSGPLAGVIVAHFGWAVMFASGVIIAIPSLLILIWRKSVFATKS